MMSRLHSTARSFKYAMMGIKIAHKNEPNFRIHLVFSVFAILASILLKIPPTEFAIVILTIGFVMILELINTMLEALVDLVSPEIQEKAKIAKDVSAASVLVAAIIAVVIGILIFLPKILSIF